MKTTKTILAVFWAVIKGFVMGNLYMLMGFVYYTISFTVGVLSTTDITLRMLCTKVQQVQQKIYDNVSPY